MPEVIYKVDLPAFTGRNVPIKEIAAAIGKDAQYVRVGLQQGILKFGTAIKIADSSEYSYYCWDDVVFEVDLLKSQEINLDYILELIYEKNKNTKDKNMLIDEIRRIVRASTGNRAKESLIVAFINQTDLDEIQDKASIIDAFFQFAQKEQKREAEELIMEEKLNEEAAKRYILTSLRKEYASENGTDLNEILPKMSPLNPQYHTKKQSVFEKISTFVEKFKGVGGVI